MDSLRTSPAIESPETYRHPCPNSQNYRKYANDKNREPNPYLFGSKLKFFFGDFFKYNSHNCRECKDTAPDSPAVVSVSVCG